jgi:hypothetical protein
MAENIMENGKTINKMELVNSSMPMELFSMVTGLMELRTEMDSNNGKMAQNTLEIGSITLCKESVITSLPMEVSMKENGLIISSMDMENKPGQMVENMRDNSIMVLNKVKVFIHGLTARNMTELGPMANNMVRACSQLPKEKIEEVFGQMARELNGLKKLREE